MQTITQTQIELYKEYLISEEKSEVTVEKYIRDISAFSRWLDCGELNKTAVLHYKQQLMETYAPTTVNSVLASLNGVAVSMLPQNRRTGAFILGIRCLRSSFTTFESIARIIGDALL